jgi:DNA-binding protein HU-beta
MNKQELIGHVADRSGLGRNDAMRAVETMLEVITSTLKRGDEVRLVGFGNFSVTRRKASTGRNPRTGEPMQIKASSQPKFRPGKVLKDAVQELDRRYCRTISADFRGDSQQRARSSAVEHTLHTGGVTGSIPVAPTMPSRIWD